MKKYKIGYTAGVYDLFHIGHLNLIKTAKDLCDYLMVGVNSDKLVLEYKNKLPIINEQERLEIIKSIKYVDEAFIVNSLDKLVAYQSHPFDVVFIGSDWKGNERWKKTETDLAKIGVDVIYLPYTNGISSTAIINKVIKK